MTDTKKQRTELARLVGKNRREGENELEAAARLIQELTAKLAKQKDQKREKTKIPHEFQTRIDGRFGDFEEATGADFDRELEKGDPAHVLDNVGNVSVEYVENGTVSIAILYGSRVDSVGVGVSKRSPHDMPNELTGVKTAVVRATRDLVAKVKNERRRARRRAS